jgi:putative RNA 2'-phosphotransferase
MELSKEISYVLRHSPEKYGLELDNEGWVSVELLMIALRREPKWDGLAEEDINEMIDKSSKKRHEVYDGKIRALYGHSTSQKIKKTISEPPQLLYHGTTNKSVENILKVGLKPQKRQYVHLSQDIETAITVGKRRDKNPVILLIESKKAYEEGIFFYLGEDKIWLSQPIPSKYIRINS